MKTNNKNDDFERCWKITNSGLFNLKEILKEVNFLFLKHWKMKRENNNE